MVKRQFPKPGFYADQPRPNGHYRVYFITGTTKGNRWWDSDWTKGEWWSLAWNCVPSVLETESFTYHSDNPTGTQVKT